MPIIGLSFFESASRHFEKIASVFDYAASASNWTVLPMPASEDAWLAQLGRIPFDGMITCLDHTSDRIVSACRSLNVPIVDVGNYPSPFSCVRAHPDRVSELAYNQFAPAHRARVCFASIYRDQSLEESIRRQCLEGNSHFDRIELRLSLSELSSLSPRPIPQLLEWIGALPVDGCGVIASCDLLAIYLLRAARMHEIEVPQRLAVVSARDSLVCALPSVSITSVTEPTREIGFQAAQLLHQQMETRSAPQTSLLVQPSETIRRGSTVQSDYEASIARAIYFVQQNALRDISVPSLLAHQSVSRVTFERRFKEAVGCSPGEYIRREKVRRIKEKLVAGSEPLTKIAKECGFNSAAKFAAFFKNAEGVSPRQFQTSHQVGGDQRKNDSSHGCRADIASESALFSTNQRLDS